MQRAITITVLVGLIVALTATVAYAAITRPDFSSDTPFPAGPGPVGIVNGRVTPDKPNDIVTANRFGDASTGDISCLRGKGDGTFEDPVHSEVSVSAYAIARADFDGDDNPDVVITDPDSSPPSVVVALGNGDCSFTEEDTEPSGGTGGFDPFDVVAADLDGDSDPDVAVTNQESNSVRIFRNDGTGNLEELDTVETGPGTNPTGIGAGKLTGDAGVDLAVALSGTGEAVVLENEGSNFDPGPAFDMANDDAPSPVGIVVGRLDSADKKADIATSNVDVGDADDDYVAVARGFGNGNFSSPTFYSSGGDSPFSLTLGNFNRESGTDIAAANQYANAPATANNGDISILTNRGNGTFVGPDVFDTGDGPNDITAGKFNGDRKADIATANFGDDDPNTVDSVSVLLNTTRR